MPWLPTRGWKAHVWFLPWPPPSQQNTPALGRIGPSVGNSKAITFLMYLPKSVDFLAPWRAFSSCFCSRGDNGVHASMIVCESRFDLSQGLLVVFSRRCAPSMEAAVNLWCRRFERDFSYKSLWFKAFETKSKRRISSCVCVDTWGNWLNCIGKGPIFSRERERERGGGQRAS